MWSSVICYRVRLPAPGNLTRDPGIYILKKIPFKPFCYRWFLYSPDVDSYVGGLAPQCDSTGEKGTLEKWDQVEDV